MVEVHRHQRITESGKRTTVRRHTRSAPGTGEAALEAWETRAQRRWIPPPNAADITDVPNEDEPLWWDEEEDPQPRPWEDDGEMTPERRRTEWAFEDMKQEMRDWRARPEPEAPPSEPMDPAKARLLGLDSPEEQAKFERLRAYRDAGYTGPLDQDNRIPDPDDPANQEWLHAGAAMRAHSDG